MKVKLSFTLFILFLTLLPAFSQELALDKNLEEMLKAEVIGAVPAEKALASEELYMEVKPVQDELEFISKETIERMIEEYPEIQKTDQYANLKVPLPGGIDHLAAGVATRNTGYGNIRLRGLNPGAVVVSAIVYFGTVYGSGQLVPTNVNFLFNNNLVTGRLIGTTPDPCWGTGGKFAAYRAFVTAYVSGNGDYRVDRLPSFLRDGRDPWKSYNNTAPLSEGASLVVLYSDKTVPYNSFVQIHHVVNLFYSNLTVFHWLPVPIKNNSRLKHTRLGADGQAGFGLNHGAYISDERSFINTLQIKGTGSGLNKDSDWNGYDGEPLNQLWDTHTMNVPYSIPIGATYYRVRYTSNGDCIIPVAHVLTAEY